MLTTRIVRKIDDIIPEEWNRVFPPVLENYYFFKTLTESRFEEFSFYFITVHEGEELVGAAPCFLMNYPLDTTVQGRLKNLFAGIQKFFPKIFNLKALICGCPMGPGRMGIRGDRARVIRAILEGMQQIARKEKVPIVAFKDFDATYRQVLDPLRQQCFYEFESLPNTEMDLPFKDFEDYLKTLSRISRYDLRRKFKKVDGHVCIETEVSNRLDGVLLDEVYALFLQTSSRGELQFEKVPKDFFKNIAGNMPDQVRFFLWRIDKKLVAFTLCLVSGDRLIDYYLGLDYAVAFQYHLYFVRFRDLLKWCLDQKIKKYEMGNTSYEPKRRLGFNFIPLYAYAKCRNPWINPFFKLLCRAVKPGNFEPVLKDMKKTSPP